jgi:hypothetical protein
MKKNKNLLVTMTQGELEDLIYFTSYRASKRANDKLFRGLLPFLNKMNDDFETIIREQDDLKILVQSMVRGD